MRLVLNLGDLLILVDKPNILMSEIAYMGFVGKLAKNPIFNMVRKVAQDECVEHHCPNHAMEQMEDFQTWFRGSQPLILDVNQATCKRPRILSLISSFNFSPTILEAKNPIATAICRESSWTSCKCTKLQEYVFLFELY